MPNRSLFKNTHSLSILVIFFSALLASCSDSEAPSTESGTSKPSILKPIHQTPLNRQKSPETAALISIIDEHFSQLTNESKKLNETLIAFTKKPSQEGLQKATDALDKVHSIFVSGYYLDTCCHIYSSNLTNNENDLTKLSIKTKLDQYPLLPGYLDAVEGYPYSGLIYSDISITRESMEQEFQLGDPAYVSLGFHALELILKGSNRNRKVSDFSHLKSTKDTSSAPAELRRTLYAILLASEIENNLSILELFWESDSKNHLAQKPKPQANKFFNALYITAEKELNNLQIQEAALEQNTKIDEHSNIEIITLKKGLLERLIAIKESRIKI
tara:strand:+ start:2060 stop:3049 length:990 start_codon:yes stop_codon:yes gene_type:complete